MKFYGLLAVLLVGLYGTAIAQDIITKMDKTKMVTKVIEVSTGEIKFRYANRPDGPTYVLKKTEVAHIRYQDGTYEVFGTATGPVSLSAHDSEQTATTTPVDSVNRATVVAQNNGKRVRSFGGLFYATPTAGIGKSHAYGFNFGLSLLNKNRQTAGAVEANLVDFFKVKFVYALVALSGVYRPHNSSKFYLGGGLGPSYTRVGYETIGRYGTTTTEYASQWALGGQAYVGYGAIRVQLISPSFKTSANGTLITVGFSSSPF